MKRFNDLTKKLIKIHENKETMKPFIIWNRVLWAIGIALFMLTSVFLYLYGVRFSKDTGYDRTADGSVLFLVFGLIIFLIAVIHTIIIGIVLPIAFRKSQQDFFKTKKYHELKSQIDTEENLEKLSLKELKWQKKLCYISNQTFSMYKNEIELAKKTKK